MEGGKLEVIPVLRFHRKLISSTGPTYNQYINRFYEAKQNG